MSEIDKAVVFAILMQNGIGIIAKAPSYIMEKKDLVYSMTNPETLLDARNLKLFNDWYNRWLGKPPDR